MLGLTGNALSSVPDAVDVADGSVGVTGVAVRLSLTKILNGTEHVGHNRPGVFDRLFNDHSLGESLECAFGHDGLLSTVDKSVLTVSEGMSLGVSSSLGDTWVTGPVVFSRSLLSRSVVAVRFNIHLGDLGSFFETTSLGV